MKSLKKSLLEFIPVFLGVVLALFFNNINESRIEKNKINGLLTKIELGTEKKLKNLNIQLAQNQKVIDSLTYYLEDSDKRITDILSKARGIRYIQFDLAAWSVLKSSELLVDVDYELVSLLYLLNESIDNSETIDNPSLAFDRDTKSKVISDLDDYLVEINYRIDLCKRIQEILASRNK